MAARRTDRGRDAESTPRPLPMWSMTNSPSGLLPKLSWRTPALDTVTDADAYATIDSLADVSAGLTGAKSESLERLYRELRLGTEIPTARASR